ncbi:MAG: hypothetical protein AAF352_04190 [Pseudomonadota bacterium]
MADIFTKPQSDFAAWDLAHGLPLDLQEFDDDGNAVTMQAIQGVSFYHLFVTDVPKMQKTLGHDLPAQGRVLSTQQYFCLWAGPDQVLIMGDHIWVPPKEIPYISPQSDSRLAIAVSGAAVHDFLARIIALDLDDHIFPHASTALCPLHHTPIQLLRWDSGAQAQYYMILPASYAKSLWHYMAQIAAQFGVTANTTTITWQEGV